MLDGGLDPARAVALPHVLNMNGPLVLEQNPALGALTFFKDAEDMPAYVMARMVDTSVTPGLGKAVAGAAVEPTRVAHSAKSNKR